MIITGKPRKDRMRYHTKKACAGQACPFHNPSKHKMRKWPMNLRTDPWAFPLIERMCEHGIGHPDPDSAAYMDRNFSEEDKKNGYTIHSCDGCCGD